MSAPNPGHAVRHRMRDQSLKIPWRDFQDACDELLRWRCFARWAGAITETEAAIPSWLEAEIHRRCPGFLGTRQQPKSPLNLCVELDKWVDHHMFSRADEGGWHQALNYYVDRRPEMSRLRQVGPWSARQPKYPDAERWQRELLTIHSPELTVAVPQYVEWEAFAFWVRLLVDLSGDVPAEAKVELDRRCRGFLESVHGKQSTRPTYSMWFWEQLLFWIEQHKFKDAVQGNWLQALRDTARSHVRNERVVAYWAECDKSWHRTRPTVWPRFDQWLADSDAYLEAQA